MTPFGKKKSREITNISLNTEICFYGEKVAGKSMTTMTEYLGAKTSDEPYNKKDIVDWAEHNFHVEATTHRPAGLIQFEPHQRVTLRYMFKRTAGRLPFQTYIYSTTKKSGKTAVGGLVGRWAAETWTEHGNVYFVGNDFNQAIEKGFAALKTSIELNRKYKRGKQILPGEWELQATKAHHIPSGSNVNAVALDYKGEAGSNPIISIWTELWGFTDKAALRFWAEMTPSPTRPDSVRFVETYAGFEGESELLENLYDNVVKNGRQLTVQDLMTALGDQYEPGCFEEAPNPDSLVPIYVNEAAGICAYWDSGELARRMPWQKGEHGHRYYNHEESTQTPLQYRRLHLNEWVSAESEFVPIQLWDACKNPLPLQPLEKTPLCVALDAAVTGDCFGLVVVSRDPEHPADHVAVRAYRKWTPQKFKDGKMDFEEVAKALQQLKDNFNVLQVAYDPFQLEYFADRYRDVLGLWFEPFNQGKRRNESDMTLYHLIVSKRIRHDGSIDMREHIQNCNAKIPKDDDSKLRLIKKSDSRKIDLAVALSMACAECLRLNI